MQSDEALSDKQSSEASAAETVEEASARVEKEQTGAETGADQTGAEIGAQPTEALLSTLEPAEWHYPDDCYYIKMYVLCPLKMVEDALGPAHNSPDARRFVSLCFRSRSRIQ